jgi:hypothetical protein
MKATGISTFIVTSTCALALLYGAVSAQTKPDSGGSGAKPGFQARPPADLAPPEQPESQPPGDDGAAAQGDPPAGPGCPDRGRKLELIV